MQAMSSMQLKIQTFGRKLSRVGLSVNEKASFWIALDLLGNFFYIAREFTVAGTGF